MWNDFVGELLYQRYFTFYIKIPTYLITLISFLHLPLLYYIFSIKSGQAYNYISTVHSRNKGSLKIKGRE